MKKILTAILAVLLLATSGLAAGETPKVGQQDTDNLGITQTEGQQGNMLNSLLSALSFSGVQSTYQTGEQVNLEITANTQTQYNTENAVKVVEIYHCADSGCDDAPPIDSSSEDQCGESEWYPDYDDCIAKDEDSVSYSVSQDAGTSWTWDVSFNGLQETGQYVLVGYVWSSEKGIVTDVSKEKFTVESTDNNDGDTDTGGTDSSRDISLTSNRPDFDYQENNDRVIGTITIENTGSDGMTQKDLLEMQIRPQGAGLLSIIKTTDNVCNEDNPENVNLRFQLGAGESRTYELVSDNLESAGLEQDRKYDVHFLTRDDCYPENSPVEPIPTNIVSGAFTYQPSDTGTDGTGGNGGDKTSTIDNVVQTLEDNLAISAIALGLVVVVFAWRRN